jgi:hypothetical protein
MAKKLNLGRRRRRRTIRIDIVTRPLQNNENHDLIEVVEAIVDQFRETLPLIDLNLTEHAENSRGCRDLHLGRSAKRWRTLVAVGR